METMAAWLLLSEVFAQNIRLTSTPILRIPQLKQPLDDRFKPDFFLERILTILVTPYHLQHPNSRHTSRPSKESLKY